MNLVMGMEKEWSNYGTTTTLWRKSAQSKVVYDMQQQVLHSRPTGVIMSLVGGFWPYRYLGKWVLFLDCDSQNEMIAARNYLKTISNLGSAVIESSPGHYWLVVNKVGRLGPVLNCMARVPGVDPRYHGFCRDGSFIPVRAWPKIHSIPKFTNPSELDGAPLEWYIALREYFTSKAIADLQHSMRLRDGIKNDTIANMASDPSFKV